MTLEQAQAKLNEYLEAESVILKGQSYTIGNRSFTRADLAKIQAGIKYYSLLVMRLKRGGIPIMQVTPHDK